jgi:prepilin-type N-terminal cleavage/methylation domain-containing protein
LTIAKKPNSPNKRDLTPFTFIFNTKYMKNKVKTRRNWKSMFFEQKNNQISTTGFTLIELLIVIGIIAILAAAVIIAINPGQQFASARDRTRESHINTLQKALFSYQIDNLGTLGGLNLPSTLTEICNTNEIDPSECEGF